MLLTLRFLRTHRQNKNVKLLKFFNRTDMRFLATIIFFISLILCSKYSAHGALITTDVSQQPISISANNIQTWDKNGVKVFLADGNVKIEQGGVQILADSIATWFTEVSVAQHVEGHMEVYCEGNVSLLQEGIIEN